MKQRPRIYYTQSQIAQMWDRWQEGVSLNEIGRMFDRGPVTTGFNELDHPKVTN